jgi:hypothetical protein
MTIIATIRYEVFHDNTDHMDDFIALTSMIHDGTDFVAYESSYFHKNKLSAEEWEGVMARIKTAAESSLCKIDHTENLLGQYECTTYTVSVYGEG